MKNSIIKRITGIFFIMMPLISFGQGEAVASRNLSLDNIFVLLTTLVVALVALTAIIVAYKAFSLMVRTRELDIYKEHGLNDYIAQHEANQQSSWWQQFSRQMTGAVPLTHEKDILLDHNYDGIRELDNNLPPWWLWGFYLTIVIAVIYIGVQHFSSYGKSSAEEYDIEIAEAKVQVEKFLSTQANLVDESNVTYLTDEASLTKGKEIFATNCVACHLAHGGGGPGSVGPNLTDKHWLNGGSIQDVFKTIKYGVVEKGMQSWKEQLRPSEIHEVSSYILSLQGSNPPNAKEPQGDLYEPK